MAKSKEKIREIVLFGRRLRSLRKAGNLTQEELGDRAGLSYKYLGAVERGKENPSLETVAKLAKALGIEMNDMFEFEHEEMSQAKLRKQLDTILKKADADTLRKAVKLLRALIV